MNIEHGILNFEEKKEIVSQFEFLFLRSFASL